VIKKILHMNGMPESVITEPDAMLSERLREQLNSTGPRSASVYANGAA